MRLARTSSSPCWGRQDPARRRRCSMIAGFEEPDAGTVELAGRDVSGLRPVRPRGQHGLPGLRALPPHERRREHRLRPGGREGGQGRAKQRGDRGPRDGPPLRPRRPQAVRTLRRPAPARRIGPGDRQPATGSAARRAARCPRPEAARAHAGRAQADPGRGRHHLHLRHPRPGRSPDDARPDRGLQQGEDRTGRCAARKSTSTRSTSSSPSSSGSPTRSTATSGRFTVRPEKIRMLGPGEQRRGPRHRDRGRIVEIAYVGMVTRVPSSSSTAAAPSSSPARTVERRNLRAKTKRSTMKSPLVGDRIASSRSAQTQTNHREEKSS